MCGPGWHKAVRCFHTYRDRLTKFHDFVPFNTWQLPVKSFLKFFFENSGKLNDENFQGSSSIRWKIKKSRKKLFFCNNSYFFLLNLYCTWSQLSFEVHNRSVAQNLQFFRILGIFDPKKFKISNFELQKCYIPQKKAQNMYNKDSARKSNISSKKNIFFSIFQFFT